MSIQLSRGYRYGLVFRGSAVCETEAPEPPKLKLLDQVRDAIRARHCSRRTEECYVGWIRRFIIFHGKRHPMEMGEAEITGFLSALAVKARVSASTQNQALSALLFLYRDVLNRELPWLDDVVRARTPRRLPVVFTRDEVRAVPRAASRDGSIDGDPTLRLRAAAVGVCLLPNKGP